MRLSRLLSLLFLAALPVAAQQINPNQNIRWSVAAGCGVSGYTYSPATGTCIPAGGAAYGWINNVATQQTSTATTLSLLSSVAGYPSSGTFYIDSEYETYTGINYATNQFTGLVRGTAVGAWNTASVHNPGSNVISVNFSFNPYSQQQPYGGVFGYGGGGNNQAQELVTNCATPQVQKDRGTNNLSVFAANCSNPTWIDSGGAIHQNQLGAIANFMSPIYISPYFSDSYANGGGSGLPLPIVNTTNVAQTSGQYQFGQPIGFSNGLYGPVVAKAVPNIPAPTGGGQQGGSCSITYEIAGVDADGGNVPGGTLTLTGLTFPNPGIAFIQTPQVAGVVTYNIWRTAVSGCGSTTVGKFTGASSAQYPLFGDTGAPGDGTSPPASNTSVAKSCVNGESFCQEAGPGTTPAFTCSTSTRSWMWHNTSATASPFAYVCNGTSFVTAF